MCPMDLFGFSRSTECAVLELCERGVRRRVSPTEVFVEGSTSAIRSRSFGSYKCFDTDVCAKLNALPAALPHAGETRRRLSLLTECVVALEAPGVSNVFDGVSESVCIRRPLNGGGRERSLVEVSFMDFRSDSVGLCAGGVRAWKLTRCTAATP